MYLDTVSEERAKMLRYTKKMMLLCLGPTVTSEHPQKKSEGEYMNLYQLCGVIERKFSASDCFLNCEEAHGEGYSTRCPCLKTQGHGQHRKDQARGRDEQKVALEHTAHLTTLYEVDDEQIHGGSVVKVRYSAKVCLEAAIQETRAKRIRLIHEWFAKRYQGQPNWIDNKALLSLFLPERDGGDAGDEQLSDDSGRDPDDDPGDGDPKKLQSPSGPAESDEKWKTGNDQSKSWGSSSSSGWYGWNTGGSWNSRGSWNGEVERK